MTGESVRYPTVDRRTVLRTASAVGGLAMSGSATAKLAGGPAGAKGCEVVVPDDYATVQAAVDAAAPGDKVCVKASGGPYREQVVLNKDLWLRGVDEPRIQAPSSPKQFTFPETGEGWEPVLFAYGGSESGGRVTGAETVDVKVTGITVDGADRQPKTQRSAGILARNTSGSLSDNTVERMGTGGKETFGILAYGDSELRIVGNDIRDYERGGIGGNGGNGGDPAPTLDVRNNTVTGTNRVDQGWAPNGIQLGFGAGGKVLNNLVRDNRWAPDIGGRSIASSILIYESSDVMVQGNTVTNADAGLVAALGTNNRFVNNEVEDAYIGAYLWKVDNGKIVNNVLTDTTPDPRAPDDFGIINSGDGNNIIGNQITGFDVPINDQGTDTNIQGNDR